MKKNNALSYGLLSLAVIIAMPLLARAGTWQPLNNQPPMPDITDPHTIEFLCEGGAEFPMLLTDGSVIVRNLNSQQLHVPLPPATEKQRRRRTIFNSTLRAAVPWANFRVAPSASIAADAGASLAPPNSLKLLVAIVKSYRLHNTKY